MKRTNTILQSILLLQSFKIISIQCGSTFRIPELQEILTNRNKNPKEVDLQDNDEDDTSNWNTNMEKINLFFPTHDEKVSSKKSSELNTKLTKTGTTIVGCIADNGATVILGADSRSTSGSIVADKQCEKIVCLASNVWCCGAGTSGDIDALTRQIHYTFKLHSMNDNSISNHNHFHNTNTTRKNIINPSAICNLLRNSLYDTNGQLSVNLVLGGYSYTMNKAVLVAIHPHGSIDYNIPFTALGSGSLAAMSILESKYTNSNITTPEAIKLVQEAVLCGIMNDLGSGSQVDICIINKDGSRYIRNVVKEEILELSKGDLNLNEKLKERDGRLGEESYMRGVSGFGSLPFIMKTRKGSGTTDVLSDEKRKEFLDQILDL